MVHYEFLENAPKLEYVNLDTGVIFLICLFLILKYFKILSPGNPY